jgi:hypothetical protein
VVFEGAQWFVLGTHSHSERLVHDQLAGKGPLMSISRIADLVIERSGTSCAAGRGRVPAMTSKG